MVHSYAHVARRWTCAPSGAHSGCMRHITPSALAGAAPASSTTTPGSCDCLTAQQGVHDTIGEHASTAMAHLGTVKDVLASASALDWSGSAGSGFHATVDRLSTTADAYADDIAGVSRLCG